MAYARGSDHSVPEFFQQLTGQALGLAQIIQGQQREQRVAALQAQVAHQNFLREGFGTLEKISGIDDPGTRNAMLDQFHANWLSPHDHKPLLSPETLTVFKKSGADNRALVLSLINKYGSAFGDMEPEQLATMIRNPVQLFDWLQKANQLDKQQREQQAEQARRQAYAGLEQQGAGQDLDMSIANVQRGIIAGEAQGADMSRAQALLGSLQQRKAQTEQARHLQAQEQISRGQLGVAQAGLGETRRHHGALESQARRPAAGGTLDELASQVSGGKVQRYFDLPVEQQSKVYDMAKAEKLELASAARPLPAAQVDELADMQGNLDMLSYIDQLADPAFSGWARGRAGAVGQGLGITSPQEVDFRTALQSYTNIVGKARAGANFTAQELTRLQREAPQITDAPEVLKRKIEVSRHLWRSAIGRKQEALRGGGYQNVPTFTEAPAPAPTSTPGVKYRYNIETGKIEEVR